MCQWGEHPHTTGQRQSSSKGCREDKNEGCVFVKGGVVWCVCREDRKEGCGVHL